MSDESMSDEPNGPLEPSGGHLEHLDRATRTPTAPLEPSGAHLEHLDHATSRPIDPTPEQLERLQAR